MDEYNKANTKDTGRRKDACGNTEIRLIQISIEENQALKDEISRLKGQKPRPIIKSHQTLRK